MMFYLQELESGNNQGSINRKNNENVIAMQWVLFRKKKKVKIWNLHVNE